MTLKFPYKNYGGGIYRPVIPIEVAYHGVSVPYEVLVDSGADACIFDAQLTDILRFDVTAGRPHDVSGITGEKETYYVHPVSISVGGWQYEIEAGFLQRIGRFGYGVVGQRGFFDRLVVSFDYQKKVLELKLKDKR